MTHLDDPADQLDAVAAALGGLPAGADQRELSRAHACCREALRLDLGARQHADLCAALAALTRRVAYQGGEWYVGQALRYWLHGRHSACCAMLRGLGRRQARREVA